MQELLTLSEEQLQSQCFLWHWNNRPLERGTLFHINQKSRNRIEGNKMKAMGVVPGVADFCNIRTPMRWIEMKTETGVQSPDQRKFQQMVESVGHTYVICRSFEAFKELFP